MVVLMLGALLASLCGGVMALPVVEVGFNEATIVKVEADLFMIAAHSWELGTEAEALLELQAPGLSVFRSGSIPPPSHLNPFVDGNVTEVLSIANNIVKTKAPGTLPLTDGEGAVGDPASLGVAVIVANWTRENKDDQTYDIDAWEQLDYLTNVAPKTDDGAISHRADQVQLWHVLVTGADFVYMAPPFIAFYGAVKDEPSYLQLAYDQCRLYRQYLRDESGLWQHIVLGNSTDPRHWGTGNAWAAAGMFRVLETIRHSGQAYRFGPQQADLTSWIHEIISKVWQFQHPNGTLFNVIDDPTTFADSSSTALLAAVTYRYAALTGDVSLVPAANRVLNLIRLSVDADGWLHQTVDPETFDTPSLPGQFSPEGQAFVLLLHAAWRDFVSWVSGAYTP
ncbi:hypothetical protein EIP86_007113 [Pleurotus ostreatoroseus]|nr:hypothetical protein EIP86_007113 [Pleurotus ostreatoroseus]